MESCNPNPKFQAVVIYRCRFRQEHMQVAGKCQSPKNCLQRALTSLTRKLSPPVSLTTYPRCHRERCRELPGQVKCVSQA